MLTGDRQAFLDISDMRYGDSLSLVLPQQRERSASARRDSDERDGGGPISVENVAIVRERRTVPAPGPLSERSGGGVPGEVTHFTGRDGPMAELRARIGEQTSQKNVVTVFAIDGMAGVGKTAFARRAAQEFAERYRDGAIWVDLYGHTPGMQPREPLGALEQMLLQLGVPPEVIKADLAERQDQWRHHTHGRRMLTVLDNARTSDQVLALLPEARRELEQLLKGRRITSATSVRSLLHSRVRDGDCDRADTGDVDRAWRVHYRISST